MSNAKATAHHEVPSAAEVAESNEQLNAGLLLAKAMGGKELNSEEQNALRGFSERAIGYTSARPGIIGLGMELLGVSDAIRVFTMKGANNKIKSATSAALHGTATVVGGTIAYKYAKKTFFGE